MDKKWTDRQYHVQGNAGVAHTDVGVYCNTNQFPALPFLVDPTNLMTKEG